MEGTANGEDSTSSEDLYGINLMPSEVFFKFRKETEGFRIGVNLDLYNAPLNEYRAKLVLKPVAHEHNWKLIYEPFLQDVQLVSKKIPVTQFLNLQIGVGHSFQLHATGWKWKLTTSWGGDGMSRIQNKTLFRLCPSVDFCFRWRADYVLPRNYWVQMNPCSTWILDAYRHLLTELRQFLPIPILCDLDSLLPVILLAISEGFQFQLSLSIFTSSNFMVTSAEGLSTKLEQTIWCQYFSLKIFSPILFLHRRLTLLLPTHLFFVVVWY